MRNRSQKPASRGQATRCPRRLAAGLVAGESDDREVQRQFVLPRFGLGQSWSAEAVGPVNRVQPHLHRDLTLVSEGASYEGTTIRPQPRRTSAKTDGEQ